MRQHPWASQRSLHNAPIFRLLLKVAVKGTHQCDCINFWGASAPTPCKQPRVCQAGNTCLVGGLSSMFGLIWKRQAHSALILAEGARALSVTLSGGALFASSNSRQVWSSRSFLQFLGGLRPNTCCAPLVEPFPLRSANLPLAGHCVCLCQQTPRAPRSSSPTVRTQDHFYSDRYIYKLQSSHFLRLRWC